MMASTHTDYVKMAMDVRRKVFRLTLQQQLEILQVYNEAIENLIEKASRAKEAPLTKAWASDYAESLTIERARLQKKIEILITSSTHKAAGFGIEFDLQMFAMLEQAAELDLGPRFRDMFSSAAEEVVKPIILGELYKDKRSLSARIWNLGGDFKKDIQYIINRGIIEKKSAVKLAEDLEKYVELPAKRPTTWGKAYPWLKDKVVDYNAQRLARTSISHAYQTVTIKSSSMNPFTEGIEWFSALQHKRTCGLCWERHGKIFPKDDVPLDHPNGLCTMLPYIPKSLDQVAGELRDWADGGYNPRLDEWHQEYGTYFVFKQI